MHYKKKKKTKYIESMRSIPVTEVIIPWWICRLYLIIKWLSRVCHWQL